MRERVGDVGDQRAGLGVDLAALQAEAPVDAVRPVAEPPVGDGHGPDAGLDARRRGPAQEDVAVAADRMGVLGVVVRIAPRPGLAGDGELLLDPLVVRAEIGVGDRPVGADAVHALRVEVRRVKSGGVPGVVDHRPAHATAGVVAAQRYRVGAADLPGLGPVEGVRAPLVADPVAIRVPEGAGVQADDLPAGTGQPLRDHRAAGAGADHDEVDLLVVVEAAHVGAQPVVGAVAVIGQQPRRLVAAANLSVVGAPHASPPCVPPSSWLTNSACAFRARSVRAAKGTGSSVASSGTSKGSRASMPMFL